MSAERLPHGSALSEAQAAQLLTRAAQGERLNWAPVKVGPRFYLAHLGTLSAQQLDEHRGRVSRCAQLLNGEGVPAQLTA